MFKIKDFRAEVKAAGDGNGDGLEEGQFEAIVSVFGNEDSVGDVVIPGAFKDSLATWEAKGEPIPVIWSHDWADPFAHIGHVLEAKETDRGLWVKGQLDLENPTAVQVWKLMKSRRVTQFSFAYDIIDGGWGQMDGRDVYELRKLDIFEVGPCLLGANRETELIAAKAAVLAEAAKAGRVLSQKNYDALVSARDIISEVIAAAEPEKALGPVSPASQTPEPPGSGQTDEQPSQDNGSPADEEPQNAAKSDRAAPFAARRALAVATIETL